MRRRNQEEGSDPAQGQARTSVFKRRLKIWLLSGMRLLAFGSTLLLNEPALFSVSVGSDQPSCAGEDRPEVHRHHLQVWSRALPDRGGEEGLHGKPDASSVWSRDQSLNLAAPFVTWFAVPCELWFHSGATASSGEAGERRLPVLAPCSLSGNKRHGCQDRR